MKEKGDIKVIVMTEKDRKLLTSINKSLKDIQRGRVSELIVEQLKRHK